ncbi:MAG: hypothetical protein WDM79_05185 [Terricaulis sp.]
MIGALALAALGLAACASDAPENAPAWFTERLEPHSYPSLQDVPTAHVATTDEAHWNRVEADLLAAQRAMKGNPRSEPAPPTDPEAFTEEARDVIDDTAATH